MKEGRENTIILLKEIEYGVHGDLITIYPKPYSIYLRATISWQGSCQADQEDDFPPKPETTSSTWPRGILSGS